jgi:hypothetical protein
MKERQEDKRKQASAVWPHRGRAAAEDIYNGGKREGVAITHWVSVATVQESKVAPAFAKHIDRKAQRRKEMRRLRRSWSGKDTVRRGERKRPAQTMHA